MSEFKKIDEVLDKKYVDKVIKLRGWVYRKRELKDIVFLIIRDSSNIIQCIVKKENEDFEKARKITTESSLEILGVLKEDKRAPNGYEIEVKKLNVYNIAERFPITKDQSKEFLLDVRHLWIRSRKMNSVLKVRSTVFSAIREFFTKNGYYEVQAPSFTKAACEGGATLFEVKYFDEKVYLTQSWQLYAEAMIFSLEKIFCIAPSFRAEKSRTRRHLTEFWHAECEEAWKGNDEIMETEEKLICYLIKRVIEERKKELEFLKRDVTFLEKIKPPFPRIRYEEAIDIANKNGLNLNYKSDLGADEERVISNQFSTPFFIHHYPKELKAFYHRPDPKDPEHILCNDLLAPEGYGEIIGGGERIWEKEVLIQRIKEQGLNPKDYEWYIDLRRYGSIPHAGFGLGIERFVTWICKLPHIMDSIPFPRTINRFYP
ncbi:MAG: asparagine--tRNA ligase [Candidatus Parvarchaeota archaeon]|nr:asparagine--tRNA ligase [Candidatus Jingweiarchaeum tengchongense]MCW1298522.1 asparagine--tRNA ligase [Candidatus Jingweiarchaeum tengchongense]MCW1300232.1 asparagine--tRNA ligase [Candidatus Jingweiarchaeum tengchongense]MCW1304534.1 asparagine--tRNA ligase [Candidatus Jingweiarchaeum tengchongense]MCW1305738.1 asparagine--tRNA ligase [Candidatus Jingweiarchaeum tengchongense]